MSGNPKGSPLDWFLLDHGFFTAWSLQTCRKTIPALGDVGISCRVILTIFSSGMLPAFSTICLFQICTTDINPWLWQLFSTWSDGCILGYWPEFKWIFCRSWDSRFVNTAFGSSWGSVCSQLSSCSVQELFCNLPTLPEVVLTGEGLRWLLWFCNTQWS